MADAPDSKEGKFRSGRRAFSNSFSLCRKISRPRIFLLCYFSSSAFLHGNNFKTDFKAAGSELRIVDTLKELRIPSVSERVSRKSHPALLNR
jgi:hypothetical protein